MKYLTLLGIGLSMLTSLLVSVRLLLLYARTRQRPELLMAVGLLFSGFLAFAVGSAGKILFEGAPTLRATLTLLGLSCEYIGVAAMALFARQVFHPDKRWARGVIGAFAVAAVGVILAEVTTGEYLRYSDAQPTTGPWVVLALAIRGFAPAWVSFECFRFHAQLRKRMRIGLAEPLVVQRVGLWAIAIAAPTGGYIVSILHRLLYGTGLREHAWAINTVTGFLLVSAISLGLAFFPPRAYRERLDRASRD